VDLDLHPMLNILSPSILTPWQSSIVAIVDPVTFAAQRMSPLLRIVRDELRLPLTVYLAPAELIDGESKVPITSYYRFVANAQIFDGASGPEAHFEHLPVNHVLTLKVDVPEPWNVQQSVGAQDTDNLRCDTKSGCGDDRSDEPLYQQRHLTQVEYDLKSLLIFGRCVETSGRPPNGLQLVLYRDSDKNSHPTDFIGTSNGGVELGMDGSVVYSRDLEQKTTSEAAPYSDTLVMLNIGYWQLQAAPGVWSLQIASGTRGASMFDMVEGTFRGNALVLDPDHLSKATAKRIVLKDFVSQMEVLVVQRRPGFETASLFPEDRDKTSVSTTTGSEDDEVINVFSLATGHLYERFLKIMMLSVTKRTSTKVKFWLFENYLSPSFKASARYMAEQIGSEVEFVTYKWPEWLRGQSEKQRIIWGYKILFLDVLFPLSVKKFIYVDADQVLRGDLKELWDLDLQGAPYGYTPFCTSRETTLGYQFWREGFWKQHLGDMPYHISALYVVDLELFRRQHVGDTLRSIYQQLSADPHSLANLDQDLPNYAQRQVPIFSLPQEWLWCESWCSDETKATAKTIDLCNNPLHKEPKVSMAKRVISGPLFNESWVELDAEVERYDQAYRESSLVVP
jgi:UDP-glucose:glycoprotein glucosyltransferase